jgi:hypothetical protein
VGFLDFLKKTVDQAEIAKDKRRYSDDPWKKFSVEKGIDDSAYQANIDAFTTGNCPNCEQKLGDPAPKNCPACGEPVVAARHFATKKKMLLTKEQAEKLKAEKQHYTDLKWALELAHTLGANDREMMSMVKASKIEQKFVVLWVRANDMSMHYASKTKWLSYRNMRLAMADILNREGKKKKAIGFYLSVCFLDLNGPDDAGDFQAQGAALKRPVVQTIVQLAKELALSEQELQSLYMEFSTPEKNRFMPFTPAETWEKVLREYNKIKGV